MGRNGFESASKKQKGVFGGERFRHIYPNGDQVEYIVVVFECEITSGKLKSIDGESLKLQYFSFSEKPTLALPYQLIYFYRCKITHLPYLRCAIYITRSYTSPLTYTQFPLS